MYGVGVEGSISRSAESRYPGVLALIYRCICVQGQIQTPFRTERQSPRYLSRNNRQMGRPVVANGNVPYVDGWRDGSWTGFSPEFVDPAPWYFRTIENWNALFSSNGFALREVIEPINPKTQEPASIIFIGELTAKKAMQTTNP